MIDGETVYLLDDEPDMLQAISRLLKAHGFAVQSFEYVQDFFDYERPVETACLLLDLAMPEMDGLQVQKQLVRQGDTIPILFLTGHGDIPASVRALKSGAENFLTKPIDATELIAAVRDALEQAKSRQAQHSELLEIQRRLDGLTNRQRAVFEYVISGKMNKQIAAELGTGEQNIKIHRRRVMRKMGAKTLADLVRMAERLGVQPTA